MKSRLVVGPPPIKYVKKYGKGGKLPKYEKGGTLTNPLSVKDDPWEYAQENGVVYTRKKGADNWINLGTVDDMTQLSSKNQLARTAILDKYGKQLGVSEQKAANVLPEVTVKPITKQVEDVSQKYPTFSGYIRNYKEANPNARLNSRQTIYKLQQQYLADMPNDYRKKVWEPQVKKLEKEKSNVGLNYIWDPSKDPVTKMIGSFGDITGIAAAANKVLGIKEIPELTQKQLINKSWQLGTFNVQPGYGSSLDYVGLGRIAKVQQAAEGVKQLGTLAKTGSELAKRGAEVGKYTSRVRSYNISGDLTSGAKGLGEGMKTVGTGPKLKSGVKGITDILSKEGDVIKSIYKYLYGGSLPKKQLGGMANVGKSGQTLMSAVNTGLSAATPALKAALGPVVGSAIGPLVDIMGNAMLQKKQDRDTFNRQYSNIQVMAKGGMIKRKDGSYSRRGLWDNIRANKGSGKKPTKEMLEQERKIKAKMEFGGMLTGKSDLSFYKGRKHANGGIMVSSKGTPSNKPVAEVEGGETRFKLGSNAYIFSDKLTL
jgi:hypothetical protein